MTKPRMSAERAARFVGGADDFVVDAQMSKDWDEDLHPRGEGGRFGSGGGAEASTEDGSAAAPRGHGAYADPEAHRFDQFEWMPDDPSSIHESTYQQAEFEYSSEHRAKQPKDPIEVGRHIEKVTIHGDFPTAEARAQAQDVADKVVAGLANYPEVTAYLADYPLGELRIEHDITLSEFQGGGSAVAAYHEVDHLVGVKDGDAFTERQLSISAKQLYGLADQSGVGGPLNVMNLGRTPEERAQLAVLHEIGHHVLQGVSDEQTRSALAATQRDYEYRRGGTILSNYSKANAKERFAEAFALYAVSPRTLWRQNRAMYDVVRSTLGRRAEQARGGKGTVPPALRHLTPSAKKSMGWDLRPAPDAVKPAPVSPASLEAIAALWRRTNAAIEAGTFGYDAWRAHVVRESSLLDGYPGMEPALQLGYDLGFMTLGSPVLGSIARARAMLRRMR